MLNQTLLAEINDLLDELEDLAGDPYHPSYGLWETNRTNTRNAIIALIDDLLNDSTA